MKGRRLMGLAFLPLAFTAAVEAKPAPAPPPVFPGTSRLLWIGAHPDDEVLAAPLLHRLCVDEGVRCSFLVLTRGEAGFCRLPGGCRPDLGTVRTAEMERSARLFGADLDLWDLPDGGSAGGWDAAAGSHAALVARLAAAIADAAPDLVLTFDPRHGTTCHSDHRGAGRLAIEALPLVGAPRPALYLLATRALVSAGGTAVSFLPAAGTRDGVVGFDATATWSALDRTMAIHASQFSAPLRRAVRRRPRSERAVFVGPAELLLSADVVGCP